MGRQPGEVAQDCHAIMSALHPEDRERVEQTLLASVPQKVWHDTFRTWSLARGIRWLEVHASGRHTRDGGILWSGYLRDITRRREMDQILLKKEAWLQSVLASAPVPLGIVGPDQRVEYLNEAFVNLFGYTLEALPDLATWWRLAYPEADYREAVQRAWGAALASAQQRAQPMEPFECEVVCRSGERRVVNISATVVEDALVISLFDLTERKQYEQALEAARKQAEVANLAKRDFLSVMGHELLTPMNATMGYGQLLAMTDLSDVQRAYLEAISGANDHLLALIKDLLEYANTEAEHDRTHAAVDFAALFQTLALAYAPLAEQKGLALHFALPAAAQQPLLGDVLRIRQILGNLLANAVKFTVSGTIIVELRWLEGRCEVSVRDTGVGIPPDRLGSIFEPFEQADNSMTRDFGGVGLGLAISRKIADQIGATLRVESQLGLGSRFTLVLPSESRETALDEAPVSSPSAPIVAESAPQIWADLRVLLAEDAPDNAILVKTFLKDTGCRIDHVEDGSEAVRLFCEESYDLVLMDIQMPVMDGLEATRQIRAIERERTATPVPIIALTAHGLPEDRANSLAAGCDIHFTKPFRKAGLLAMIAEALAAATSDRD